MLESPAHAADPPPLLPLQGYLTDAKGTAIDGIHDLRFSLFSTETGQSSLYAETHEGVLVEAGDFVVYLGEAEVLPLDLFRDRTELWLEVVIDGSETIAPRFRLATAPYAGSARYCGDASTLGGSAPSDFSPTTHTHEFSGLEGLPAGLGDGDDDLLSDLDCANGQLVKRAGGGWGCGDDGDTFAGLGCTSSQVALRGASAWGCATLAPVATSGSFLDLTDLPSGPVLGTGSVGYLPVFDGASSLVTSELFQDSSGNVGIGTVAPDAALHVDGNIRWGDSSMLRTGQGGAIELGDSSDSGTTPYIDFHFGNASSDDFDVRLVNSADGQLQIYADHLRMRGASVESPNVVLGHSGNAVTEGVEGASVLGGGSESYGPNLVTDNGGVVAGGYANQAGDAAGSLSDQPAAAVGGGLRNTASGSWSSVGGGLDNLASASTATVAGGNSNSASGSSATIGGGYINVASGYSATVSGGYGNNASASSVAIGGGYQNVATGDAATIPGGYQNSASGDYSFAAGFRANASAKGCFTWSDTAGTSLSCNTENAWVARTSGGVTFYTSGNLSTGVTVAAGAGSWASASDRNLKHEIVPVQPKTVLAALERVPVATWKYKTETSGAVHMGPMAQDFKAAFGLGDSDKTITSVDADGVALAAVKGVHELTKQLSAENVELRARIARLEKLAGATPPASEASLAGWGAAGLLGAGLLFGRRKREQAQ